MLDVPVNMNLCMTKVIYSEVGRVRMEVSPDWLRAILNLLLTILLFIFLAGIPLFFFGYLPMRKHQRRKEEANKLINRENEEFNAQVKVRYEELKSKIINNGYTSVWGKQEGDGSPVHPLHTQNLRPQFENFFNNKKIYR